MAPTAKVATRSMAAAIALGLTSCRSTPPLTEARVLEDLGRDELTFTLFVPRDDCLEAAKDLCRERAAPDPKVVAAQAAGWIEPICTADRALNELTPAGRSASARWRTFRDEASPCNSLQGWEFVVARYDRTGPPVIRPGADSKERLVTIPGRWIPNEDGRLLVAAGFAPIVAVDREEKFTYFRGAWARRHGE